MGSANGGEWQLAVVDWLQPFQNYWDPGSLERREKEMGGGGSAGWLQVGILFVQPMLCRSWVHKHMIDHRRFLTSNTILILP